MTKMAVVLMVGLGLAGCNSTDRPTSVSDAAGSAVAAKPTQAQMFARNEWLACLRRERASGDRGRAAADAALSACTRQEEALLARLSEDPSMTPARAKAGLEQVKASWRAGAVG